MRINNENITVRDFEESDIENKVKWINDSRNNEFLHYNIPLEYEKTLEWFKNKNNEKRQDCVIEYTGIPVGLIGLLNIDKVNRKAEYYISMGVHDFKRKGIATVATQILLEYAFGELGLNKVYLNVDEDNKAACRLYEKTGFCIEGRFVEDMVHKGRLINRVRYAAFAGRL